MNPQLQSEDESDLTFAPEDDDLPEKESLLSPWKILIIDDEEAQLLSLKSFLSKRGYDVFTSTSGEEGIQIINNNVINR